MYFPWGLSSTIEKIKRKEVVSNTIMQCYYIKILYFIISFCSFIYLIT